MGVKNVYTLFLMELLESCVSRTKASLGKDLKQPRSAHHNEISRLVLETQNVSLMAPTMHIYHPCLVPLASSLQFAKQAGTHQMCA